VNRLGGTFETATITFSDLDEQVLAGGATSAIRRRSACR
jgi:hypothetical protein